MSHTWQSTLEKVQIIYCPNLAFIPEQHLNPDVIDV